MRKVWVRRPQEAGGTRKNDHDDEEQLTWIPGLVVEDGREDDGDGSFKLKVQLTSWEELNRKSKDVDSDDSDSDEGENEVDEDQVYQLSSSDVLDRNEWDSPPDDLVQLVHLHEPAILQALCERFWASNIYTWCGPILLALNPFERLPLYKQKVLESYSYDKEKRGAEIHDPHVYAVAADAYASLVDKSGRDSGDQDQSILISGESGAGKTESTKIVMQYLATVARKPGTGHEKLHVSEYLGGDDDDDDEEEKEQDNKNEVDGATNQENNHVSIEQQVLESNPILEAFGNAKTIRNDNSSRFGKFIQIQFDGEGYLVGAAIATYLLEKVRIIQQGEGERGYHVFYQMLKGGSVEEKARWKIDEDDEPSDFNVLNAGDCYERNDGVDDAEQLHVTKRAMKIMGIEDGERDDVLCLVAVVLHLGNLEFISVTSSNKSEDIGSTIETETAPRSAASLQALEELLGIPREAIIKALCTRNVNAGGETFEKPLSPELAADTRDALAKSAYSRAFDWLVGRVNECIRHKSKVKRFIGVLDIFGFEIFKHNSFEQLCINYANERLQQQFNDFVFKHEQSIYAKEKINWSFIDFPSNAKTVELIDGSTQSEMGILAWLDDECRLPKGTDQGFVRKLYENFESREGFEASKPQRVRGEFVVHHYAGQVVYDSDGFCDKNRDALRQEAIDLMSQAGNKFVKLLFDESTLSTSSGKSKKINKADSGSNKSRRSALSLKSVGAEFKNQLSLLIETIGKTAPHYIRCIKPNDQCKAKYIYRPRVVSQLRCGGVLEAVRVARAGFPIRMPHNIFIQRYGRLAGAAANRFLFGTDKITGPMMKSGQEILDHLAPSVVKNLERSHARSMAKNLLQVLKPSHENIEHVSQVGKTKVFLRKEGHDLFERWLSKWTNQAGTIVFAYLRGFHLHKKYVHTRKSLVFLQSRIRGMQARRMVQEMRQLRAAICLQSWIRQQFYRHAYNTILNHIRTIQRYERGRKSRVTSRALRIERARKRLQCFARGYRFRRDFLIQRRAMIKIQCMVRQQQARERVKQEKRNARDLTHIIKERDELREKLKQLAAAGGKENVVVVEKEVECSKTLTNVERRRALLIGSAAIVTFRIWNLLKSRKMFQYQPHQGTIEKREVVEEEPEMVIEQMSVDKKTLSSRGLDQLSPGTIEGADWYKQMFGEELQHLDECSTPSNKTMNLVGDKPHEGAQHDEESMVLEKLRNETKKLEEELDEKRRSVEIKRAELADVQKKLKEEQNARLDEEKVVKEADQAALEQLATVQEELRAMNKELEETKQFLGQQTGLKNRAEMRQGELELQLSAAMDEKKELKFNLDKAEKEKKDLEQVIEKLKDDLQTNQTIAKSAAVIELEAELRTTQQDYDELKVRAMESAKMVDRLKQAETAKTIAWEEYRSSSAAKIGLLEKEMKTIQRAKMKSEAILQARVLIDRRSRRVAQKVVSAWAFYTVERRNLRNRAYAAKRMFESREVRKAFKLWADGALAEQNLHRRLDKYFAHKERNLVRSVFKGWQGLTKQSLHVDVVAECIHRRTFLYLQSRVFQNWRRYAGLRAEERILFNRLVEVFEKQKLERLFKGWRRETTRQIRGSMLVEVNQMKRGRLLLCKVFNAWVRVFMTSKKSLDGVTSDELVVPASPKPENVNLVATLMKRMEQQDAKIEALLKEQHDRDELDSQVTPPKQKKGGNGKGAGRMLFRSPDTSASTDASPSPTGVEIHQLESSDDDDGTTNDHHHKRQNHHRMKDSFYNPSPPRSHYRDRKTQSAKFSRESLKLDAFRYGNGNGNSTSSPMSQASGNLNRSFDSNGSPSKFYDNASEVFRSPRRKSLEAGGEKLASTKFSPPFQTLRLKDGADHANALVRSTSQPMLLIGDHETALGTVDIKEVDEDGTLVFREEPQPVDLETVLQTAHAIGIPPIIMAAQHGMEDALRALLAQGVDPNVEHHTKHRTALHAAIQAHQWDYDGSERMVELLLEKGANVHAKNNHGNSPLMEAVVKGDAAFGMTRCLIRHGALSDPKEEGANEFGQTPLHAAVRVGALKTMHLLLDSGSSLTRGDSQGQTALHHAARLCNVSMIENLLGYRSMRNNSTSPPTSKDAFVDIEDIHGNTALHLVCSSTSPEMVRGIFVLLENDADANKKNKAGQTPVHILCSNDHTTKEAISKFHSPPVRFFEQDRNGNTPLHVACQLNSRDIACMLVKAGAELFVVNNDKETPLNLVPQGFAIKLLRSIRRKPDEKLAKRIHREISKCMLCSTKFGMFLDQHMCKHCGRSCCSNCSKKQFPIVKFGLETSQTVCDHCFSVLTMNDTNDDDDDDNETSDIE